MLIKIFDKEIEFNLHTKSARAAIEIISKEAQEKDLVLSHIIVDGNEVRNDLIKYLEDHKDDIEVVEAVATNKIMLPAENAMMIKVTLDGMIPVLEILPEDFRQGISARGWKEFETVIDTILFVDKATKRIFTMFIDAGNGKLTSAWDKIRSEYLKLDKTLKKLQKALDDDEIPLSADIIQNEIKPVIEKTSELIEERILKPVRSEYGETRLQ